MTILLLLEKKIAPSRLYVITSAETGDFARAYQRGCRKAHFCFLKIAKIDQCLPKSDLQLLSNMVLASAKSLKEIRGFVSGSSARCTYSKKHLAFAPSVQATVLADSQSQFLEILLLGVNNIYHSSIDLFVIN